MRKKLLAIIAVAAMVVTMIPAMAFADDSVTEVGNYYQLVTALKNGENVKLIDDITVDTWYKIGYPCKPGTDGDFNLTDVTIDGNGKTIKVKTVESAKNGEYLFSSKGGCVFKNLTFDFTSEEEDGALAAIDAGANDVIENVTILGNGADYGIMLEAGETVTIKNCTFKNLNHGTYGDPYNGVVPTVKITDSTFENCKVVSIIRGDESVFSGNTVKNGKLNVLGETEVTNNTFSVTEEGSNFEDNGRIKFYNKNSAKEFSGNEIKKDAYIELGAEAADTDLGVNYYEDPDTALAKLSEEKKIETLKNALYAITFVGVLDGEIVEESREDVYVTQTLTQAEIDELFEEVESIEIDGYVFKGYFMDETGQTALTPETVLEEGDTVYMIWEEADPNGGSTDESINDGGSADKEVENITDSIETPAEKDNAVDTGDNMNMVIPFAIAGLALAAMAAVVATRRRVN